MGLLSINCMSNLKSQNKFSNYFFVNQTCSIRTYPSHGLESSTQQSHTHIAINCEWYLIETCI
jgi:hypothetical protein